MSKTQYHNFDFYFPNITKEKEENDKIDNLEEINKTINKKAENLKFKKLSQV